eukprot:831263-Amphidinium_carterae.1
MSQWQDVMACDYCWMSMRSCQTQSCKRDARLNTARCGLHCQQRRWPCCPNSGARTVLDGRLQGQAPCRTPQVADRMSRTQCHEAMPKESSLKARTYSGVSHPLHSTDMLAK